MKILLSLVLIVSSFSSTIAQKMKLVYGSVKGLKSQASFDIKFTYDSVLVGRGIPENEYLNKLTARWEKREKGKGILFRKKWFDDRQILFEPAFIAGFKKAHPVNLGDKSATYTLIVKTNRIEGGWDFGVVGSDGIIGGELWIVESADSSKVKAIIKFYRAKGNNSRAGDFGMTMRIKSAYASAGRWLAIFLLRKSD